MPVERRWQVYLLECLDGSLYAGVAVDVARRYAQHAAGKGAKYTRSHPPRRLLAVIDADGRSSALRQEHAIKRLSPEAKRALAARHPPGANLRETLSTEPARQVATKSSTPADTSAPASHDGVTTMLKTGDRAPAFSLASDSGKTISSASLKGKSYILYFYPKDDTPGCTREACAFRDQLPAFGRLDVPVFGISADSEKAHARFAGKHALGFPLLADPERQLIEAYGAWVEKSLYGRKYMGIARCTFAVGKDGRIAMAWDKVKPDTHAAEVVAWLAGAAPTATAGRNKAPPATGKAIAASTRPRKKAAASAKTGKPVAAKATRPASNRPVPPGKANPMTSTGKNAGAVRRGTNAKPRTAGTPG